MSSRCCDEGACPGKGIAGLLHTDSSIIDQIRIAACAVSGICGKLSVEEMRLCASRLFNVVPECTLADAFVAAYEAAATEDMQSEPVGVGKPRPVASANDPIQFD